MATITIEDVPESVVKAYGSKIKYSYDMIFSKKRKKISKEDSLLTYINSDEYKNEKKNFVDSDIFVKELKSKLNTGK